MIDTSRQDNVLKNTYQKTLHTSYFSSPILLIGCGGIGSVLAELLVRGGFLNLTLIDFDIVEKTNIQRQNFTQEDIELPKVEALKNRLVSINPMCNIEIIGERFTSSYYFDTSFDILFDCTDSIETRKEIHLFSQENNIPWVYSGAIGFESSCGFILSPKEFLFEKLFPYNAKNQGCEEGVLASTTYTSASLVYSLFIQYLIGAFKDRTFVKFDSSKGMFIEAKL